MINQQQLRSVEELVQRLGEWQLLSPLRLEKVARAVKIPSIPVPGVLQQLVKQGWLTAYQVEKLTAGQGKELVLGSYILLEPIGQGGMGQVFKARHRVMDRTVALKVIRPQMLADPEAVRRFDREIKAVAQLSHPNIVTAFDAEHVGETHFLVMEYCQGQSLGQLVRNRGPLPVPVACDYIRQAALGLQHAFEKGLTHRDIKPENLLVTGTTVKILDLGLARFHKRETSDEPTDLMTQAGILMGTPDYVAPEQARDARGADVRADLYSLGCTFYFLLSGRVPFPGGTLVEKILRHQTDTPTPLERIRPEIPVKVLAIVGKLMARDLGQRYQTPVEVAQTLLPFSDASAVTRVSKPHRVAASALGTSRDKSQSHQGLTGAAPSLPPQATAIIPAALSQVPVAGAERVSAASPAPQSQVTTAETSSFMKQKQSRLPRYWWLAVGGGFVGIVLLVLMFRIWPFSGDNSAPWIGPGAVPSSGPSVPSGWKMHWNFAAREQGPVLCVAFAPDNRTFAGGWGKGLLKVWDAYTEEERYSLAFSVGTQGLAFGLDSVHLAIGYPNHSYYILDLRNSSKKSDVNNFSSKSWVVVYLDEGQLILAELNTGKIQRTHPIEKKPQELARFRPTSKRNTLSFLKNGKRFAGINSNGQLQVWDLAGGGYFPALSNPMNGIDAVALNASGDQVAAAGERSSDRKTSQIRIWDVADGKTSPVMITIKAEITLLLWTPDGHHLLAGTRQGELHLCNTTTGKKVSQTQAHQGAVKCGVFSPDAKFLVTGGADGVVKLWSWSL